MASRGSRADQFVTVEGLDEAIRSFNNLDRDLRRNANGELRRASKSIAASLVPMLGGSGSPQEDAILAAAGPKSDRYVVVAIPNRKPKLSGVKNTPAAMAKRLAFPIESGSDAPQFNNPRPGAMIARHRETIAARAVPRYLRALEAIMRRYNLL